MNYYQQPCGYQPWGYQQPFVNQPYMAQPYMAQPMVQQPGSMEMGPYQQPVADGRIMFEQSYIENILRLNIGKVATVYMNFENSQWGSKIFKGYLMAAGRDHIILRDLTTEVRYLLLMVYLNYVTFDEDIEYEYPYRNKEK